MSGSRKQSPQQFPNQSVMLESPDNIFGEFTHRGQVDPADDLDQMTRPTDGQVSMYTKTEFRVLSTNPFKLCIDEKSSDLLAAYREFDVATAGFLTAWKPRRQERSEVVNAVNQAKLMLKINALGLSFQGGLRIDPSSDWRGEPSILVLGLERMHAVSLGNEFHQNEIVWAGADAIPRLVLLR